MRFRFSGVVLVVSALQALGPGCGGDELRRSGLAAGCKLNSDCTPKLVCSSGLCHSACVSSRDCPETALCVKSDSGNVCQLTAETKCTFDSECSGLLVCGSDGRCRNECKADRDCVGSQVCATGGFCAEPEEVDSTGALKDRKSPDASVSTGGSAGKPGTGGGAGSSGSVGSGGGAGSSGGVSSGGSAGSSGGVSSGGSAGAGGGGGRSGSDSGVDSGAGGGSGGNRTDDDSGAAGTDSAPPVCTTTDRGPSIFARWPMPTEKAFGLSTAQSFLPRPTVVDDDITGLVWQRGASAGKLTRAEAVAYCQNLSLAGCNDWRLPTMIELVSITDLTKNGPAIDGAVFPGTPPDLFWTSTVSAAGASRAWIVSFAYSDPNQDAVTQHWYARCVRDPVAHSGAHYVVNTDTVVDNFTHLTWQRNPVVTQRTLADAKVYCSGSVIGGLSGWRLPTRNELLTVADVTKDPVAVDTTVFGIPATVNYFWTSSIDSSSSRPWFVAFREGGIPFADPLANAGVRCVR